jgi:hypothetical protein
MKALKIALGASMALNVAAVVYLLTRDGSTSTSKEPATLCDRAKADLDFFIDGLNRGNDAFYSPLIVRTLEPVMEQCLPASRDDLGPAFQHLRASLLTLITVNADPETKRRAHDDALKIFRELRGMFDGAPSAGGA